MTQEKPFIKPTLEEEVRREIAAEYHNRCEILSSKITECEARAKLISEKFARASSLQKRVEDRLSRLDRKSQAYSRYSDLKYRLRNLISDLLKELRQENDLHSSYKAELEETRTHEYRHKYLFTVKHYTADPSNPDVYYTSECECLGGVVSFCHLDSQQMFLTGTVAVSQNFPRYNNIAYSPEQVRQFVK